MSGKVETNDHQERCDHDFVSFGFFWVVLEDAPNLCCLVPAGRFNTIFHDVRQAEQALMMTQKVSNR